MRSLLRATLGVACLIAVALPVAGCSDATLTKINASLDVFDARVANFNAAADRIDVSIAKTSAALGRYCDDAKAVGGNLVPLVQKSDAARAGIVSVTKGIETYCTALPSDIGSALVAMSAVVKDGAAAYKSAKAGN